MSVRAEVAAKVNGKAIRLRMPIGGLEKVAEVNPKIGEVHLLLRTSQWEYAELKVVLSAGLEFGSNDATADSLIEDLGFGPAAELAADLMSAAFGPANDTSDESSGNDKTVETAST